MRSPIILSLVLLATPAAAQTELPPPPMRSTYIEASCSGGFAGRFETVRVMADGRVLRLSGRAAATAAGRVKPARYDALSRRLDRAGFDGRTTPRPTERVFDGIDCRLTRVRRGVPHEVALPQAVRSMPKMRDLAAITDDVLALGRDAATPRMRPAAR